MRTSFLLLAITAIAFNAVADSSTLNAAIGGGVGGATGAAIGNELGNREGAIIGGALGGAIGAAVNTDYEPHYSSPHKKTHYIESQPRYDHPGSHFCLPGQAKKNAVKPQQCPASTTVFLPFYDLGLMDVINDQLDNFNKYTYLA